MPNPRRKFSKTRSRTRWGQEKARTPRLKTCPQCFEQRQPHHVCPKCGYYAERSVMPAKED